tara:strand:- start:58 stop:801 length:744 start_codon:yes stop_codon:yes gene_type:complete
MDKKLNNDIHIFLIGGNSTIGQAITQGLKKKYSSHNEIKVTSFARGQSEFKNLGDIIYVKNYIESILYIKEVKLKNPYLKIIVVISFGVLVEEKNDISFYNNLTHHLDVNTFQPLKILSALKPIDSFLEVHLVSSILADFIRPSLYSYSFSKSFLEILLKDQLYRENNMDKLYIWKPAYVASKLNEGRSPSFIKTNPEKIEKIVSNTKSGGFLYIPKFTVILTRVAKKLSSVIKLIDKKSKKHESNI